MSARRDVAEDLIEAVRKEAVGEVAKGVVKGVKVALIAALAAICALVWSLWTANPVATVALAVVSLAFGTAVGAAAGWRRAVSAKDAETTELKKRPTQEDVDELRAMLDEKDAEKRRVKAILSSLDGEKKGLVGIALSNGAIDEHTEAGNRAFLSESGILSRVDPSPIKPFASYTLSSLAASILAEDAELMASVVDRGAELSRRIQERSEGSKRNSMLRELRKGFRALDPCQRSVVMSAYFAEAEGYVPKNDDERRVAANASNDLVLRDMVRYDKSSGRLFLADDARAMIEDGDGALIGRAVRDGMESEVVTMRERAAQAEARLAEHEDEDAKKRKKAESEVIGCVRSMGFYARKVIYRIMTEGPQTIDDDWLSDIEGAYFFDRITFKTRLKNHKSKVDMKPGIKAFLMENPELFDEVREEVARELEKRQRAESRVLETGKPMSTGGGPAGGAVPAGMMTVASGLAESLNRAMKQMDGASEAHDAEIAPLDGDEGKPTAASDGESTDGEFSTITPAQARILRNLFESEGTHISTADGNVRSLLEKGIIHVVGRDTRTPLTGDQFEISDEWTKRINTHYDEFKRHCSLKS